MNEETKERANFLLRYHESIKKLKVIFGKSTRSKMLNQRLGGCVLK